MIQADPPELPPLIFNERGHFMKQPPQFNLTFGSPIKHTASEKPGKGVPEFPRQRIKKSRENKGITCAQRPLYSM
jgi:hypothetical protein